MVDRMIGARALGWATVERTYVHGAEYAVGMLPGGLTFEHTVVLGPVFAGTMRRANHGTRPSDRPTDAPTWVDIDASRLGAEP